MNECPRHSGKDEYVTAIVFTVYFIVYQDLFNYLLILLLSTNCATIHGIEYRAGCCLYIGETELYPCFGTLKEILVIQDEKFFVIQPRITSCYSEKLLAYNVGPDLGEEFTTTFLELKYKFVVSKRVMNGQLYVQFTKWGDVELDL